MKTKSAKKKPCVFCEMPPSEIARVLYEDRVCRVLISRYPVEKGHLLVVSKAHYDFMLDAPDPVIAKMFGVAKRYAKISFKKFKCKGMDIGANIGIASSIHHFHIHIMPRYSNRILHFAVGKDEIRQKEVKEIMHLLKL
jgi:histidine triad (HIT) family protein